MADQNNQKKFDQPKLESSKPEQPKVETPKVAELTVVRVEDDAVIVRVDGWKMRTYFDKSLSENNKAKLGTGRVIKVEYLGDITNAHTVTLLPLKFVE